MIDKKTFENQKLETHGIIEQTQLRGATRVPDGWSPITDPENTEVRDRIKEISWEKTDEYCSKRNEKISTPNYIERVCSIPPDTLKKTIAGKCRLTRRFLAKFTVGLKLEIDVANELFRIHSGELNLTNDFDYIVYHALKTKDDIDTFLDEIRERLNVNLDKDRE